ncbi:MAG: GNAT family N-acetyltransferase [Chroococcus sp. CMT-3BRIN-NPC107]|jgi:RimJ/RimL family protein N-acetyltransferase|nr:GNAT family N-acetyltransferase [Chroococcus sp. CMT-3BRIN-NPC107]
MFNFHLIDTNSVSAIVNWRYEPPYDLYNYLEEDATLQYFLNPQNNFYKIVNENGDLVGYCSFGQDGQVSGGDYRYDALDIGMRIRPDLAGQGKGIEYANAVLGFTENLLKPKAFRVTIAAFNRRALRLWQKLEFEPQQSFERKSDGMQFIILVRVNY